MSEYQPMLDDDDEPRECDSCSYPAPLRKFDGVDCDDNQKHDFYFCEICASTRISLAREYPSRFPTPERYILQSIGWVGNKILEEIRKLKDGL